MSTHRKYGTLLLFIAVFVLGIFSDQIAGKFLTSLPLLAPVRQKGYSYISPLLYCGYANEDNTKLINKLHTNLKAYITDQNTKGITTDVSVYIHDPTTGEGTTINGKEQYAVASLIKVPLMMMVYKEAETNPSFLTTKLQYNEVNDNSKENFKPTGQAEMRQGNIYTIDDLVSRMIDYSDNNAMNILTTKIQLNEFNDDLEHLNVPPFKETHSQIYK